LLGIGVSRAPQAKAANLYWDNDADPLNNSITTGAGLGGTGTWDTSAAKWFDGVNDVAWSNTALDIAYFTGSAGAGPVTLGGPIIVGGLVFNSTNFRLAGAGNSLTLSGATPPSVAVNGIGTRATIDAQIAGSARLLKTGNGVLALSNNSNNFTGGVLVNQGTLVVTDQSQLGGGALISVNGANQLNNTGGQLILQGGFAGRTFDRYLSLSGRGFNYANSTGAAFTNIGQGTISGNIAFSNASGSAVGNAFGNLTLSGVIGLSTSQGSIFGAGNGNFIISGQVTGSSVATDRFIKTQPNIGTSIWLANLSNNFVSDIRIDGGTVRVASNLALGLSTSATAVDLNGGTLEALADAPDFSTRNIRVRDGVTGGIFLSRSLDGSGLNQTVTFGTLTGINTNSTLAVSGRNGYSLNIGAGANIGAGGNGNVTFNNNGNGLVTLNTPSLWNSTNTDGSRTLTIGGNAETTLTGIINANPGSSNHNLTKSGSGTFVIQGTTSNFRGNANVTGGTLSIGSFGAINNNATPGSGALQLNAGVLSFTGAAGTGAGETVSKAVNLNGTTGLGAILANQTGSNPTALIIANSIASTGAGIKTFFLGGNASTSILNQVSGVIQNNSVTNTTGLTKVGGSTWVYSPSVASYGTAPSGITVNGASATNANSFNVSNSAGLAVGQLVSGTGVPAGAIITNINGNTISINANIGGTAIGNGVALTFTSNANFTGAVTVGGGTLRVVPTATTGLGSNLFANTQNLVFNVDNLTNNGAAGGVFQLGTPAPALTAALTQTMGALTLTAGAGRVQVDTASFANTLSFASLGTRVAGATVAFAPAATNAGIQFATAPAGSNGVIGGFATIVNPATGAVDFAATPTANSNIAALGASTVLPVSAASPTTNYILNTPVTTTADSPSTP
jgi:autotransporter-associated beta strand protein